MKLAKPSWRGSFVSVSLVWGCVSRLSWVQIQDLTAASPFQGASINLALEATMPMVRLPELRQPAGNRLVERKPSLILA